MNRWIAAIKVFLAHRFMGASVSRSVAAAKPWLVDRDGRVTIPSKRVVLKARTPTQDPNNE